MKGMDLFEAMQSVDDRYIEEAAQSRKTVPFRKKKNRWLAVAAAALVISIILPNLNASTAYAMQHIPVLGYYFKAVTFREFTYEAEHAKADVKIPRVTVENGKTAGQVGSVSAGQVDSKPAGQGDSVSGNAGRSAEEINRRINELTDQLIEQFKTEAKDNGFAGTLDVQHEVVTDNDHWYTLKLIVFQAKADGYEFDQYYTIDKTTGKLATLPDLFRTDSDYVTKYSDNIKEQMREQMKTANDKSLYFLDSDMPEFDFQQIKADQNYYWNEKGQLVLCFDEGEVAPMYMGTVEFTMPAELTDGMLVNP